MCAVVVAVNNSSMCNAEHSKLVVSNYYVSIGAGAWQTDATKTNIEYNNETTNEWWQWAS